MTKRKDIFVDETPVTFETSLGEFKYKPTTAGDENDWIKEYITVDTEGNVRQDYSQLNKCKTRNLLDAPFTPEEIEEVTGQAKEWSELNHNQQWTILSQLRSDLFDEIMEQIREIDHGGSEEKKD